MYLVLCVFHTDLKCISYHVIIRKTSQHTKVAFCICSLDGLTWIPLFNSAKNMFNLVWLVVYLWSSKVSGNGRSSRGCICNVFSHWLWPCSSIENKPRSTRNAPAVLVPLWVNTLSLRQNDRHLTDDIFKCIFLNENVCFSIEILLKIVPEVPINTIPALA